jgi:HNH endonuclease/AP2 domain
MTLTLRVFTRRVAFGRHGCWKAGEVAGSIDRYGHRLIWIDGVRYKAHRLAWLYMRNAWPREIDHKNAIGDDNRWENLRVSSHTQNIANSRISRNNKAGHKGVSWAKRRHKWLAQIHPNRRGIFLGYFDTPEAAALAYATAACALWGPFARPHWRDVLCGG